MNCKDCIHYGICKASICEDCWILCDGCEIGQKCEYEICDNFKDKSQIIDFSTYPQTIYFIKQAFDNRWILEECVNITDNCLIFSDKSKAEAKLKELNR